jgi:sugar lactone lactonase YvrE
VKKIVWSGILVLLVLAAFGLLWPAPIEPVAWQAPAAPGYTGAHAANNKLAGLHQIALGGEVGPEYVLPSADGTLYVSVASGRILRMNADGGNQQVFSTTGGRPLGMAFDGDGKLIVADAVKGLLRIDAGGKVTALAAASFANSVVVAASGKIYFTDSSMRFAPAKWGGTMAAATLDVMEQSSTGRVLEYDPASGTVRIVASGLSLANGIALNRAEDALFVSECGRYRVWKIAVAASALDIARPSTQAQVLFDNLPGYPDNLMRGMDGKIWLGLAGQRNALDAMSGYPMMRKLALRIMHIVPIAPESYGHVMAFREDGTIVADLQDPSGNSPITTGVTETAQRLYIQNVDGAALGWMAR